MDDASDAGGARAGEARGGHLGFVAHEIRNPHSTAHWTAELLVRMGAADPAGPPAEKLTAICLRSIARVRQLVEDHLLSERIDAGGLPLRIEPLGVAEVVGAVLERRATAASKVPVDLDPALAVEADRLLLERAVEALVAVAGAEATPVTVRAEASEGEVALLVAGRPADPAALADPVKGAPGDPSGHALAVPLARRIAAALGGGLASTEEGWKLTLPRARAYTPRPSPAARP